MKASKGQRWQGDTDEESRLEMDKKSGKGGKDTDHGQN